MARRLDDMRVQRDELARASVDFLHWFRVFVGESAYNEIRSDEFDAFCAAINKSGVTKAGVI